MSNDCFNLSCANGKSVFVLRQNGPAIGVNAVDWGLLSAFARITKAWFFGANYMSIT
jgi:hypothetical protein